MSKVNNETTEEELFDLSTMSMAEDGTAISKRIYNVLIGIIILYGLGINVAECYYLKDFFTNMNKWVFIVGYIVLAFGGILLIHKAKKPFVSFLGYNIMCLPIGGVVSICVGKANQIAVLQAFITTTIIVALMTLLGTIWQDFFIKTGRVLIASLTILLIVVVSTVLITGTTPIIYSWIASGIFTLFIGYDWARAQVSPKTMGNAVMNAASLYLDIINLFAHLLSAYDRQRQ